MTRKVVGALALALPTAALANSWLELESRISLSS